MKKRPKYSGFATAHGTHPVFLQAFVSNLSKSIEDKSKELIFFS